MTDPAIDYNKVAALPAIVRSFCYNNDGWIVGSAATWLLGKQPSPPRDFDILIPFYAWGQACRTIPEGSPTNSHGGVKIITTVVIDIWAGDIGWFMGQVPTMPAYAVSPKTMTFLVAGRAQKRVKS